MEYKFDNDFRFKDTPDESTPINADNLNKALDNTSWLKSQLDGTIESKTGSNIEINDSAEAMLNKLEIEGKSTQDGEPSPDNPVEIKSVGYTNLFDSERWYNELRPLREVSMEKVEVEGINYYKVNPLGLDSYEFMKGEFKQNTQYTIKFKARHNLDTSSGAITGFKIVYTDGTNQNFYVKNTIVEEDYTITTEANKTIDCIRLCHNYNGFVLFRDIILVEGTKEKNYIPYGKYGLELTISKDDESKTTTFVLNEPLRSLPTGVKDLLYIKNGDLFVSRNIEKYIFTGNELWRTGTTFCYTSFFKDKIAECSGNTEVLGYSNRFFVNGNDHSITGNFYFHPNKNLMFDFDEKFLSMESLTTFLKENETNIYCQLATPVIEDLGEIQMPITYKDKSTITTTDELEPTINLEYVKDTILTDYIEKRLINLMK